MRVRVPLHHHAIQIVLEATYPGALPPSGSECVWNSPSTVSVSAGSSTRRGAVALRRIVRRGSPRSETVGRPSRPSVSALHHAVHHVIHHVIHRVDGGIAGAETEHGSIVITPSRRTLRYVDRRGPPPRPRALQVVFYSLVIPLFFLLYSLSFDLAFHLVYHLAHHPPGRWAWRAGGSSRPSLGSPRGFRPLITWRASVGSARPIALEARCRAGDENSAFRYSS